MNYVKFEEMMRRTCRADVYCLMIVTASGCSSPPVETPETQTPEITESPSANAGTSTPAIETATPAAAGPYEADPASLATHPLPQWFSDAKLGLFIHYGPYSVPAFAPRGEYAEWYSSSASERRLEEVILHPGPMPEVIVYHQDTWGASFAYEEFSSLLSADRLDASELMQLAHDAGMRYVVTTAKHHDGYVLYDSALTEYDWEDSGPGGDVLQDLRDAADAEGLKFGLYYSLLDWNQPDYPDREDYVAAYLRPQLAELVERYTPAVLWADGGWGHSAQYWESAEIIADYYNYMSRRGLDALVNDRFGLPGDFATLEYSAPSDSVLRPTEVTRGMGESFGYNQNERDEELESPETLLLEFIDVVAKGGTYLLNIGPDGDFALPEAQRRVLEAFAEWMSINAEAIHGSRPWVDYGEGEVRYTLKEQDATHATLYAIAPAKLGDLFLPSLHTGILEITGITLLGSEASVGYVQSDSGLQITRPGNSLPVALVYAIHFERSPLELGPLSVSVSAATLGEPVTASLLVNNRADTSVTEELILYIDSLEAMRQTLTLAAGESLRVAFELPTLLTGDNPLRVGYRRNRVLIDPIYLDRNDNSTRDLGEPVASSLRDALDMAEPYDTLRLTPGYYRSDVNVWPVEIGVPVRILGEPGVVLDGGGATQVLGVATYGVTIQGLEIGGLGSDDQGVGAAVSVEVVNQVVVRNNFIRGALRFAGGQSHVVQGNRLEGGGLSLQAASLAEVSDNLIVDNRWGPGILLRECQGATVRGNRVTGNLSAIQVVDGYMLELSGNELDSRWWGIQLEGSSRITVLSNTISNTMRAIELLDSSSSILSANRMESCDTGMLFQGKTEQNTVEANTLVSSRVGFFLWDSGVQTIRSNNLTETESYVLFKNAEPVQSADGNYWGGGDPAAALGGEVSVKSWAGEPF